MNMNYFQSIFDNQTISNHLNLIIHTHLAFLIQKFLANNCLSLFLYSTNDLPDYFYPYSKYSSVQFPY